MRVPSPYGVVLVMSPWNYPLLLSLDPAVEALAAGNTVVLKPSAYAPRTSEALVKLFSCLPDELACVITGGREENARLLDCKFDSIFFTGSAAVGRLVMEKAAKHLTPVTLELGGKSPCIVDATANVPLAAKRIAFGKFLNCGRNSAGDQHQRRASGGDFDRRLHRDRRGKGMNVIRDSIQCLSAVCLLIGLLECALDEAEPDENIKQNVDGILRVTPGKEWTQER